MLTASCVWAIVVLMLVQEQSMAGWAEVDWVSIVPNIITGAVGLAGIGGSLVSAKMAGKSAAKNLRTTLAVENERAKLAEKRRIYANCLSSLNLGFYAASIVRTHRNKRSKEYGAAVLEANRARMMAANAINEVRLSAPPELGSLADKVLITVLRIIEEGSPRSSAKLWRDLRSRCAWTLASRYLGTSHIQMNLKVPLRLTSPDSHF